MGYEHKHTQNAERSLYRIEPNTPEEQRRAVVAVLAQSLTAVDTAVVLNMLGLIDTVKEMAKEAEGVQPDQLL